MNSTLLPGILMIGAALVRLDALVLLAEDVLARRRGPQRAARARPSATPEQIGTRPRSSALR